MRWRPFLLSSAALAAALPLSAQISLTSIGGAYTQDFDNLFDVVPANNSVVEIADILPSGWYAVELGSNANTQLRVHGGTSTTGDTYLFGADGSNERALGGLASNSLTSTIGAVFTNNTGATVTSLHISFDVQQWRLGAVDRQDIMTFTYQLGVASITADGTWSDFPALDALSVVTSGSLGALDGNANSQNISATITGLDIPEGVSFAIRWTDVNIAGNDDSLAIDNFSITAIPEPGTYAAIFGLIVLGFAANRRRRKS